MQYGMNPWKCEKCGKRYSYDEFFALMKADKRMHCECGYVFTHDRWDILDYINRSDVGELGDVTFRISTIYKELIGNDDEQYETMIFVELETAYLLYDEQYKTRAEAEKGHYRAIELIKSCKFNVIMDPDGDYEVSIISDK